METRRDTSHDHYSNDVEIKQASPPCSFFRERSYFAHGCCRVLGLPPPWRLGSRGGGDRLDRSQLAISRSGREPRTHSRPGKFWPPLYQDRRSVWQCPRVARS